METLRSRGALILGVIPENALVVSTFETFDWSGMDIRFRSPVDPADKLSPNVYSQTLNVTNGAGEDTVVSHFLVLFHEDVEPIDARRIVAQTELQVKEHPNLAGNHLMLAGTLAQVRALADWDEVALVMPASEDLVNGVPVSHCSGVLLDGFVVSPLVGEIGGGGWGIGSNGRTQLGIAFGTPSKRLSAAAVRAEIERALREWSRVVKIDFVEGSPTANRAFQFTFGTADHGDPFPFTGTTGVIAHAFFPAPPNPEPLAGDVHFNDDMAFRIGSDIDLYSVALHELGHSLGLQHNDSNGAVMYPYYRMNTALSSLDIANIRQLYASTEGSAYGLALSLNPPPARTDGTGVTLAGSVSGAKGNASVEWKVDRGGSGTSTVLASGSWSSLIPLQVGANEITITARDSSTTSPERKVIVTRNGATSAAPPSAPTLQITEPSQTASRTTSTTIRLAGRATNLTRLTWSNDRGGSGETTAAPDGTWTVAAVNLSAGDNKITVTGEGGASASITVTLETTAVPGDRTAPQLSISSPSSSSSTTQAQISVRGSASDPSGVAEVTWANSAGGAGTAAGTQSWSATVPLLPGFNTITIRAKDTAGNLAWRSVTVNRR